MVILDIEVAADAMEFGGVREPSVNTDNFESFQGLALSWALSDPADDKLLLSLLVVLDME